LVFINCPFDADYQPLLRAACFTILASGHTPRCALDYSDGGVMRFSRIVDLIAACEMSIHDVSRTELDPDTGLPRFNMPLELGADLGLRLKGSPKQKRRKTLILDAVAHRYDVTLSDISGMDIEVHGNEPARVIRHVRDWLNANRDPAAPPLAGAQAISADYDAYLQVLLPDITANLRLDAVLSHIDFIETVKRALPQIEAVPPAV
jgi:hypothetical protein